MENNPELALKDYLSNYRTLCEPSSPKHFAHCCSRLLDNKAQQYGDGLVGFFLSVVKKTKHTSSANVMTKMSCVWQCEGGGFLEELLLPSVSDQAVCSAHSTGCTAAAAGRRWPRGWHHTRGHRPKRWHTSLRQQSNVKRLGIPEELKKFLPLMVGNRSS